jgi:hypothetical protein
MLPSSTPRPVDDVARRGGGKWRRETIPALHRRLWPGRMVVHSQNHRTITGKRENSGSVSL